MKDINILIVDDEEAVLDLLDDVLTEEGYAVTAVASGREALAKARENPYDLLVADLKMPDVDGMQVIKTAKALHPETEVIIVTGYGSLDSAVEAMRREVYDYITKPVPMDRIRTSARNALSKQALARENQELVRQLQAHQAELEERVRQATHELELRVRELSALNEMGNAITSTLDLEQILALVVRRVNRVIGGEATSLLLLERESGDLVFHIVSGGQENQLRPFRLQLGQGIAGWVAQEGKALLVPDVSQDARHYRAVDEATGFVTRALLCAPLKVKEEVTGVIEVINKVEGEFTQSDLRLLASAALLSAAAIENARLLQRTQELAIRDGLTGLYNHRYFHELLGVEMTRARRYRRFVALVMLDIDFFKQVNDSYGHPTGDRVLESLAEILSHLARETDHVARYGGEEFAIVLPEASEKEAAALAERIRQAVEDHEFIINSHRIKLTVSLGVASSFAEDEETKDDLIRKADHALYEAKRQGRNRVGRVT